MKSISGTCVSLSRLPIKGAVAGVTMLAGRPSQPQTGMGHWLWYYLTSAHGRAQLAKRITVSATLKSLSARNLGEVEVPVPSPRDLDTVARLVEASESAYTSAVEAARLRRDALRDSLIKEIERKTGTSDHFRNWRKTDAPHQDGTGVQALASRRHSARPDRRGGLQELHLLDPLP